MNDLVMFTVSRLLTRYPEMNATFLGGEIRQYHHVHLGFAVDTPKGLMVPVLRFADQLSLTQLSAETRRLASACRDGNINPDELAGSTFTISNLGAFGIESFTPVLNTPEVAILGVSTIVNAPIETPDGIGIEKRMGLSLTIDHQAVDGAPGARFLKDLSTLLGSLELAAAL
jgi:pyruvate dehydrogenase E2 component (dihydrolipoamide acetyltransferase)